MQNAFVLLVLISGISLCETQAASEAKSSEVRLFNDRPTLFINGRQEYPIIYALTDLPGGRLTWEEMPQHNIRRMGEAGVRLFQFSLFFDQMWQQNRDKLDLSVARRLIKGVTDVCPEASLIIRLHLHPPQWWYHQHPDECVKYADGASREYDESARFKRTQHNDPASGVIRYSFASRLWQETMTAKVVEFCEQLAKTEEGNAVVGIQIAGGIYGEWHYWGFIDNLPDISSGMQAHFRNWLQGRYGTEDKLQAAWNRKEIRFSTAQVPDQAERWGANSRLFLDLSTHRNLVDYYECQHELVADCLIHFATTVKSHWGRPIVVGAFYGYFFPMFSKETIGGHLALQRVLHSSAVDFLAGPQCYSPNAFELGEPARSRGLPASCRLHGKLWLDEYDTQPNIARLTPIGAGTHTPGYDATVSSAVAVVKRNMAVSAVQGQGFWFFDFGVAGCRQFQEAKDNGSNGWWDFPPLLQAIDETRAIFARQALKPYRSDADVLMVYDTDVFYELSTDGGLLTPVSAITASNAASVWAAGVAADYVHLDDLPLVNLDQYKVVIFNNTFRITSEQRSIIKNKVPKNGRHVLWFYAPGYSDGHSQSTDNMEATTGLKLAEFSPDRGVEIEINRDGFSYKYNLGQEAVHPLFWATDKDASPIGVYSREGRPAIARKDSTDCTTWYVGLPDQAPTLMRFLLRNTPAHIYGANQEIFYVGNGMVIMHTGKAGRHEITLKNGKTVEYSAPEGGVTALLDAESGNPLTP